MGVAAVNATLQVGDISRAVIARQLAEREAPQVSLFPKRSPQPDRRVDLQLEDLDFLRQRLLDVRGISASRWVWTDVVLFQDQAANPIRFAVTQDFLLTSGYQLRQGRFFTPADFTAYRTVTVINQFLAAELFADQNPIGKTVYANRLPYTVVGVIVTKPSEAEETSEGQMFIPMSIFYALSGNRNIGNIRMRPQRLEELEQVGERAKQLLQQRYPGHDFVIWTNADDLVQQRQILTMASTALAAVGFISLLVGGVGIANIMIASVAERTSEIGLRRAIGATQQEIMVQFILEVTLLSFVGGVLAIATVHGLTIAVAHQFDLPYQFHSQTALLSLSAALLVGIGASVLPALRASQLDPVQALRSD
jgi:putative ABC transport system permease protein